MKKLLIITFFLALASMASAVTLKLESGGKSTLVVGTDIEVDDVITVEAMVNIPIKGFSYCDFLGTADNPGDVPPVLILPIPPFGVHPALQAVYSNGILIFPPGDIIDAYGNLAGGVSDLPANTVFYTFQAIIKGTGQIKPYMGPTDAFFTSEVPGYHQPDIQSPLLIIPEPMTISLLAFSGLFLTICKGKEK